MDVKVFISFLVSYSIAIGPSCKQRVDNAELSTVNSQSYKSEPWYKVISSDSANAPMLRSFNSFVEENNKQNESSKMFFFARDSNGKKIPLKSVSSPEARKYPQVYVSYFEDSRFAMTSNVSLHNLSSLRVRNQIVDLKNNYEVVDYDTLDIPLNVPQGKVSSIMLKTQQKMKKFAISFSEMEEQRKFEGYVGGVSVSVVAIVAGIGMAVIGGLMFLLRNDPLNTRIEKVMILAFAAAFIVLGVVLVIRGTKVFFKTKERYQDFVDKRDDFRRAQDVLAVTN